MSFFLNAQIRLQKDIDDVQANCKGVAEGLTKFKNIIEDNLSEEKKQVSNLIQESLVLFKG